MMTDGRLFLATVTLVCIGVFLNGLRFLRMATQPRAERRIMGLPAQSAHLPDARLRSFGRLQMAAAPLAWLFFVALCFGLLGPIKGISPIDTPWSVR